MTTTPIFIRICDNQLINLANIIGADYTPAKPALPYIDDDGDGESHLAPATGPRLVLVTIELTKDIEYDHEGTVLGVTATNVVIKLNGLDADRVWDILCCYQGSAGGKAIANEQGSIHPDVPDWALDAASRILGNNDFVSVTGIGNVGRYEMAEHIRAAYVEELTRE